MDAITDDLADLQPNEFQFIEFHSMQLLNNGIKITKQLAKELHDMLTKEVFDSGEYFDLLADPAESCYRLQAKEPIAAHSRIFLIDHFFSFR